MRKHVNHVGNAGHVPLRDVAIKRWRLREHANHVRNAGHVPLRDVAIKRWRIRERASHIHIRNAGHVPLRTTTKTLTGRTLCLPTLVTPPGDPIVTTVSPSPPRSAHLTGHPLGSGRDSGLGLYTHLETHPSHANSKSTPRPIRRLGSGITPPPSGQVSVALKARVRLCKLADSLVEGTRLLSARPDRPVPTNTELKAQWQGCQGQTTVPHGVQAGTCTIVMVRI